MNQSNLIKLLVVNSFWVAGCLRIPAVQSTPLTPMKPAALRPVLEVGACFTMGAPGDVNTGYYRILSVTPDSVELGAVVTKFLDVDTGEMQFGGSIRFEPREVVQHWLDWESLSYHIDCSVFQAAVNEVVRLEGIRKKKGKK